MDGRPLPAKREKWKTGDASLDMVLEACGFDPGDLRRAHRRRVEALEAETPAGSVDHATRLQAARDLFGMVGVSPSRKIDPEARPVDVNVVIVNSESGADRPRPALEAHGGSIRIINSERNGA